MRSADVRIVGIARESRRTGQRHGIERLGHLRGADNLSELLPILQLAQWTGIGRHTPWGIEAIRVRF